RALPRPPFGLRDGTADLVKLHVGGLDLIVRPAIEAVPRDVKLLLAALGRAGEGSLPGSRRGRFYELLRTGAGGGYVLDAGRQREELLEHLRVRSRCIAVDYAREEQMLFALHPVYDEPFKSQPAAQADKCLGREH